MATKLALERERLTKSNARKREYDKANFLVFSIRIAKSETELIAWLNSQPQGKGEYIRNLVRLDMEKNKQ